MHVININESEYCINTMILYLMKYFNYHTATSGSRLRNFNIFTSSIIYRFNLEYVWCKKLNGN